MTFDCLFCDPSRSRILYRSLGWYVRFDNHPISPGHVQIVPERRIDSLFDLSSEQIMDAFEVLSQARQLLDADYHPTDYNIGINNGKYAGRTVHHLHVHLIPRYKGDRVDPRGGILRGLPGWPPKQAPETEDAPRGRA